MIRWTKPVKFVFLLPAVFWVLAFTVFPARLFALHQLPRRGPQGRRHRAREGAGARRGRRARTQEERPAPHQDGGAPRTSDQLYLERLRQFRPRLRRRGRWASAVKVTAIFVFTAVTARDCAGVPARLPLPPIHLRASGLANDHDIADFRDPHRGRLPVLHSLLRDRRPARIHGRTMVIAPGLGAGFGHHWSTYGNGRRSVSLCSSQHCRASPTIL